jgi:SlyX protein
VDEDRIVNIETQLAHQEHTLSALNEALTDQQAQISKLEALCQTLMDRIRALTEGEPEDDGDEPPPHY